MVELRGDLPGGRRELRMTVGPFRVVVSEIPGASMTRREWADVLLSRRSYTAMWGGDGDEAFITDVHDGLDADARRVDARHYLAWVRDEATGPSKLVTMRKARLLPEGLTATQREDPFALLPIDVQLWRVAGDGGFVPLWEVLRAHLREAAGNRPLAEFRFAAMGKTGTFPYAVQDRSARARERTAVAFACIQVLAALGDTCPVWVATLCPEFQDRVLGVRDVEGEYVAPAFTRTEDVLGLAPGSVSLDNDLGIVRRHKVARPGYFVDNADGARVLRELLDEGQLTMADLEPALSRLAEHRAIAGGPPARPVDRGWLAELLTQPRTFRFLVPLISGDDPLVGMPVARLRRRLVYETKDGPFSSTVLPVHWAASAWRVLDAVVEKYTGAAPAGRELPTRPIPPVAAASAFAIPAPLAG
ncbi:MAG TPA: hypothetical protein VIC57_08560 [Candidatus Dormibacteraeota bacterium]|jgi:hypothetical protein